VAQASRWIAINRAYISSLLGALIVPPVSAHKDRYHTQSHT
jgi:hypothetical protein